MKKIRAALIGGQIVKALFRRRRRLPQWLIQAHAAAQSGRAPGQIPVLLIESESARKNLVVMAMGDFINLTERAGNTADKGENDGPNDPQ